MIGRRCATPRARCRSTPPRSRATRSCSSTRSTTPTRFAKLRAAGHVRGCCAEPLAHCAGAQVELALEALAAKRDLRLTPCVVAAAKTDTDNRVVERHLLCELP